jgi:hypothetical protein
MLLTTRDVGALDEGELAHGGVRGCDGVARSGCERRSCRHEEKNEDWGFHRRILAERLTNNRSRPTFAARWIDLGSLATRVKKAK